MKRFYIKKEITGLKGKILSELSNGKEKTITQLSKRLGYSYKSTLKSIKELSKINYINKNKRTTKTGKSCFCSINKKVGAINK